MRGFLTNAERAAGGLPLRRQAPKRLKSMVPAHVWKLVEPYGIKAAQDERE